MKCFISAALPTEISEMCFSKRSSRQHADTVGLFVLELHSAKGMLTLRGNNKSLKTMHMC